MSEEKSFKFEKFINPEIFDFLKPIQENYQQILSEFQEVSSRAFPYFENIYKGNWSVVGFLYNGKEFLEYKQFAPKTCQIMDAIPGICTYAFSIFEPGVEVEDHFAEEYENLRGHLTLTSNPEAKIIIEGEEREWVPGELMVFDHTLNHHSYNKGNTNRAVLLFDFERPEYYEDSNNPLRSVPLISNETSES